MRVLSLLDVDSVKCGVGWRLMYWKCKRTRNDLASNSDKLLSVASKAGSLS